MKNGQSLKKKQLNVLLIHNKMGGEKIEFYNTPLGNIISMESSKQYEMTAKESNVIERLLNTIEDNYNDAYKCLEKIYIKSKPNYTLYRFKLVSRFIRCNCGEMDTFRYDVDENDMIHLEQVKCPLRGTGDCIYENIVCMPTRTMRVRGRQLEIVEKLSQGYNNKQIAETFAISIHTVHNIIQQIKAKLSVKNTGQIVTWFNSFNNDRDRI